MHHPVRRKSFIYVFIIISITIFVKHSVSASIDDDHYQNNDNDINFDNNISDFDSNFNDKLYKNNWNGKNLFNKELNRHSNANKVDESGIKATDVDTVQDKLKAISNNHDGNHDGLSDNKSKLDQHSHMLKVMPLILTEKVKESINIAAETTTEYDLTVIPLTTSKKYLKDENQMITTERVYNTPKEELNISTTQNIGITEASIEETTLESIANVTVNDTNILSTLSIHSQESINNNITSIVKDKDKIINKTVHRPIPRESKTHFVEVANNLTAQINDTPPNTTDINEQNLKAPNFTVVETTTIIIETNVTVSNKTENVTRKYPSEEVIFNSTTDTSKEEEDVALFSELDLDDLKDVPDDYYDAKDVIPTRPPSTDALSVIFGLAGSVVESVAERVVPKGLLDLFKRMQKQNEALEVERLRSREENGGLGQFTRGILKSITTGISKPLNQLMAGVRDIGSLDTDRGFVSSVASGVSSVANVANSLSEAFKNRVQAIYPGTIWCGDGHSAQARSSELGLFFFTDTCCRQHDACKIFIRAGETKYGLTNTGLFTRSHCGCDVQFRECLRKTNSLVSTQIGLTYFNVLGPQCFRKAHPIVRCTRKTRLTGQKCEEYELDYTKEKMWQWFDNETF